ncbi:hypothetical protein KVR01_011854 [Diaporthe batatas]|uniref:uncharacterized protein n=1 Tax=Diaporthe batatas TaxID=748121 RepID=UPI001D043BCC|nr:uncharacterized protein KVR01_011854 [Diaporthe batatas]KAG8158093.1 hypothetical protein KVR01_011854 [Diaporthe batatas]
MRFAFVITILVASASAASLQPRQRGRGKGRKGKGAGAAVGAGAAGGAAAGAATGAATGSAAGGNTAAAGAVQRGASTLVFKEDGGVPGNECLTFRNNGEIVDAACVNEAADRQITPSTLNGADVLLVQRSFTAGFRPDLVGVQACVGFNGTTFRAEDCAANGIELVSFNQATSQLVATGGACQSGHDGAAQLTVDETGQNCATLTTTTVTPTAPE